MRLDRNKTVWQRLQTVLQSLLGQDADALTRELHPYVVAERKDALVSSGAFVPVQVFHHVCIMGVVDGGETNLASFKQNEFPVRKGKSDSSLGDIVGEFRINHLSAPSIFLHRSFCEESVTK